MGLIKSSQPEISTQSKPELDCAELFQQLTDTDPMVRRRAILSLHHCPDAIAALQKLLPNESNNAVQDAIFTAFSRIANADAIQALIPLLRCENATLRNKAAEVLQQLPEQITPFIHPLLTDTDPDVQILAINILANLKHSDAPQWLKKIIETDEHVNVCATALDLLAELGTLETIPALENLARRFPNEPYIAFAVETAIKRIQGQQS